MRLNAARQSPVSAASVPPATTTSASPRCDHAHGLADRVAAGRARRATLKPGPVGAEAHRDGARGGVGHHHRHEERRDRAVAALDATSLALVLERDQPADAGADEHAEARRGRRRRAARLRGRLAAAATASCVKRSARRASLGVIAASGSKSAQAPMPSAIPEAPGSRASKNASAPLADRGDDSRGR